MKRKVTLPDRVEALCFAALGAAIAYAAVGGSYTTLTTPRSLPYLIIGAVLLFVLATAAWLGLFHATERSVLRFLIALIIPALLIAVPFQPSSGSGGFLTGTKGEYHRGRRGAGIRQLRQFFHRVVDSTLAAQTPCSQWSKAFRNAIALRHASTGTGRPRNK